MTMTKTIGVEGIEPPRHLRNQWHRVLLCVECGAVCAVVDAEHRVSLGEKATELMISFEVKFGDADLPCVACGYFKLRSPPRGAAGSEQLLIRHLVNGTGRYVDPFVWWNPWTWGSEGSWELRDEPRVPPGPPAEPPPLVPRSPKKEDPEEEVAVQEQPSDPSAEDPCRGPPPVAEA